MKTTKNISPDTIKAYLAGTLSHAQTHELEKAMLNDAVLRDMVEGYEISKDKNVNFQSINTSLSERLQNRIGEEQKEIYPLWRRVPVYARAASVLLFLGIGFYFLMKNNAVEKAEKIASVQPSTDKNIPPTAPSISAENEPIPQDKLIVFKQKMKAEMDKILGNEKEQVAKYDRGGAKSKTENSNSKELKVNSEYAVADVEEKQKSDVKVSDNEIVVKPEIPQKPEPTMAYETQSSSGMAVPAAAPAPVMKREETYAKSGAKVTNRSTERLEPQSSKIVILNEDNNKPVPDVSIISEDKTIGKTDEKGRFDLENSLLGNKINLVAPNFENTEIIVNKTDPDLFYIRPKTELIFIDLKRNKTWKYNPTEHPAQPSVSPDDYLEYLQKNLKKSKQAIDKQVVGAVEVEFKVNKKGELLDFKIIKSLGYGCDEEAIRLIKEGPKWLPKTYGGDTGRQRVRQVVNF